MGNDRRCALFGVLGACVLAAFAVATLVPSAVAQEETVLERYPDVVQRPVTLWSKGTRLAGDLFLPKDRKEGEKFPAVIFCQGWGGTKRGSNRATAPEFAQAGYAAFTFDYRGWGESDSRLVVRGEMPKPDENGEVTVRATAIRNLVSPFDQQEDIGAAITFLEGEPSVDGDRIGLWGTSFGGGHVVYKAAHDKRVKCIVSQVGSMDQRGGYAFIWQTVVDRNSDGKVPGTKAEREKLSDEILQRWAARAGQIEDLVQAGKVTRGSWSSPPEEMGLYSIAEDGPKDEATAELVKQHNDDVKALAAIRAKDGIEPLAFLHDELIARTRGDLDPIPQNVDKAPGLGGSPNTLQYIGFVPREHTDKITIPVLLIDAENEQYGRAGQGIYDALKGRVPVEYHIFEGISHYDVYRSARVKATQLEIEWFDKHLK